MINLYYDVASRVDPKSQNDYMTNDLRIFFSRFHSFYHQYTEPRDQAIYTAILLKIKSDSIFQKQKINPSLSMYSFDLLELLRGKGYSFRVSFRNRFFDSTFVNSVQCTRSF